jgi:ribA/ribD-fused uncharacterized protein
MSKCYFWTPKPSDYKTENWRHIFSQWYLKDFIGAESLYPISDVIYKEDFEKYVNNKTFSSREKWMMVMKALLFAKDLYRTHNLQILEKEILPLDDPNKIRSLGRTIKGFEDKLWENWRYKFVVNGNYLQFSQDKEMQKILLDTGDREMYRLFRKNCRQGRTIQMGTQSVRQGPR